MSPTQAPTAKKKTAPVSKKDNETGGTAVFDQYLPYIKELRSKLFRIVIFFAIGAILGFVYYQQILGFVLQLFKLEGINLVLTNPYQFFDLSIRTGFFTGILMALPIFLYYLLQFIRPALRPAEFKMLISMLPMSIVLFICGFIFGLWVIQFVIDLFYQTSSSFEIGNLWDLSGFLSEILIMGISLGIIFQLPVVLTSLLRLKIITSSQVAKQRRMIYAALLVMAALLPTTDIVALALLTLIPLFLFEVTLLLNNN